jgi:TRAP-type C4-dicarboxylate transport system substrate-binding protein
MRRAALLAAVHCAFVFHAGALTIKMGTLAPVGSPWDDACRRLAMEWSRLSEGKVELRIYSGGVVGDESDMFRKIRLGQLGAAAVSASGLQTLFNGVGVLSFPMLIKNDGEFEYVFSRISPFFERELESRGYKVLMWSYGGWAYFFSRRSVVTPDDLRRQKLWTWVGDPDEVQAWQGMGFQTVALASTDLLPGLQSGMVDAMVTSPLVAASSQWFGIASNMCGIKIAPMWGALIISVKEWARVPADLHARLLETARRIGYEIVPDIAKADEEAISVMGSYGLAINPAPKAAQAEWQAVFDKGISYLVGRSYDPVSYMIAKKYLDEYLAAHPRN